jgi:hypothetical protein
VARMRTGCSRAWMPCCAHERPRNSLPNRDINHLACGADTRSDQGNLPLKQVKVVRLIGASTAARLDVSRHTAGFVRGMLVSTTC